jgi:hypothetical protein
VTSDVNNNEQETINEAEHVKPSVEDNNEAGETPLSIEDLIKEVKDADVVSTLAELLRGHRIASVFIDARSGIQFEGEGSIHIQGDVVGGDQTGLDYEITDSKPRHKSFTIPTTRVLSKDLEKNRSVFVKPPSYERAYKVLEEGRLLIIWGKARIGKWYLSLHLLSEFHDDQIFEIDPTIKMDELKINELRPNLGYIIRNISPDNAGQINAFFLTHLRDRLRELHSHLIITVDSHVILPKETCGHCLVNIQELPELTQLLEKYLLLYLTDSDTISQALELCQNEAIRQYLGANPLPGEVERLAELLAKVTRGDLDINDALARLEVRALQYVESWFENHIELEERTFMISLAVFNGASYQVVIEADDHLLSLIKPSITKKESIATDSVFNTRSQRINELNARLVEGYEQTEFGMSTIEFIEFNNPSLQSATLHYIWNEYDRLRKPLLDWLLDLGNHPNFDIRSRAAAAIGKLSIYNFGDIRSKVIIPWANHKDRKTREAAALALGIPVWEGELAPQVLGLLHHWSSLRNNVRLNWTACAAYGGLVGLRFPDIALNDLYTVANHEGFTLFNALNRSIISLFHAGRIVSDYYYKTLEALRDWTEDRREENVALMGCLIFLQLASKSKVEADPYGDTWPTLLWLAAETKFFQDTIVSLWRRSLNTKRTRKYALETLNNWLQIVDGDNRLLPAIKELISEMAIRGSDRERERLHFYLNRWASLQEDGAESARTILDTLQY